MRGDAAPDLVCGEGGSLLVGLWEHDGEMRWPFDVEEGDRVGVAYRLSEPLRDLAQQSLQLDVAELLMDVLGVIELDDQDRERAVVADGPVGLLADQCVDELGVPDPGHGVDHPEQGARGSVRLAVAATRAVLGPVGQLRVAVPTGAHGGHSTPGVRIYSHE